MSAGKARATRQSRSRQTLARLEAAAFDVVGAMGLEGANIADIARRAGTSVGNVYRRFENKDALLDHLESVFLAGRTEFWKDALADERWAGRTLREFITFMVREIVTRHREHAPFLRAMATRARAQYEARSATSGAPWRSVSALMLRHWPDEIPRSAARVRIPLAMEMVSATAGELILFREDAARKIVGSDRRLILELTSSVMSYITARA